MQKILRVIGVTVVTLALFATIIISNVAKNTDHTESVWDKEMTMGNLDAKNYYIIYSDLACPYCIFFEDAIVTHEEEFQDYIKKNDILVEVRLSDFLFEYGTHESPASRSGAIATYCAKDEGRFWDYYNLAIHAVYMDFFNENGGGFAALNTVTDESWLSVGHAIGLGDTFDSCVKNKKPLREIIETAAKTVSHVDGMPYFKFNKYTFSGFNPNGGWEDVLMHLDAGLKK